MDTRILIALDNDGTIECKDESSEYVNGPIPIAVLEILNKWHTVVIVSPSPYYPKKPNREPLFPICAQYGSDTMRHVNLMGALNYFRSTHNGLDPSLCLYVSNNGDYKEAEKAGFIYIDAKMFANAYLTRGGD